MLEDQEDAKEVRARLSAIELSAAAEGRDDTAAAVHALNEALDVHDQRNEVLGGDAMSGKCPNCDQTVVAKKGTPVGTHTAKGKPGTCPGSGKTAK